MDQFEGTQVAPIDGADKSFNVADFEIEDTAVLEVQNLKRTGDLLYNGKPVRIKVYSPGSKQGVKALHKAALSSQLRLKATFSGKIDKDAAQQADEERAAKLTAITAEVENFPIPGGAAALYGNPKLVDISNQVEEFFSTLSNFSRAATPN